MRYEFWWCFSQVFTGMNFQKGSDMDLDCFCWCLFSFYFTVRQKLLIVCFDHGGTIHALIYRQACWYMIFFLNLIQWHWNIAFVLQARMPRYHFFLFYLFFCYMLILINDNIWSLQTLCLFWSFFIFSRFQAMHVGTWLLWWFKYVGQNDFFSRPNLGN